LKVEKARQLRKSLTDAEGKLRRIFRNRHFSEYKFGRQEPIGAFIVDFVCYEKKLIIEIDGGQHLERADYDSERTNWLCKQGFKVIRFWNNEVIGHFEAVKRVIRDNLKTVPSPESSPARGEETIKIRTKENNEY